LSFTNPLPGVPVVESPFFDSLFSAVDPSAEERRIANDLRTNGFAVFDFPDPDFDRVAEEIKADLAPAYDWDAWRNGRLDSLRIQEAWRTNPNVRRIAVNQQVLDLLSRLYGRRAFPFQTLNFAVGTQQHAHTDSVHFSSVPERFMCGVWVALEDTDLDNGPLIYYPGSHKWPVYTNEHLGINAQHLPYQFAQYPEFERLWRTLVESAGIEPQRFVAKKGQALIWLANLLHGGDKQNDLTRTRYSQVTHYYFEDCSYYAPLASDPFYGYIAYRGAMDIANGEMIPNRVAGHDVPNVVIEWTRPGTVHTPAVPAEAPAEPVAPRSDGPVRRLANSLRRLISQ
jgi:hypothetical protein